jgi:N-acylglucosamine-6-phosphate 2-epimerase
MPSTDKQKVLEKLRGGLIVSCQAEIPEPLAVPEILLALARSAISGGAVGIRANLPVNIEIMHSQLAVPVIGLFKKNYSNSEVFITPTMEEVKAVVAAGADIVAMDATCRSRPEGSRLEDIIVTIKQQWDVLTMADISTVNEAVEAARLGFDIVATTLSGYTDYTLDLAREGKPDFNLIERAYNEVGSKVPVVAEGRFWDPDDAVRAIHLGAFAVVVGSAITRPQLITTRFVNAIQKAAVKPVP